MAFPETQQDLEHAISAELRAQCQHYDVVLTPNVRMRQGTIRHPGVARSVGIESPAMVFDGSYDVDLIGAFSYIGGLGTYFHHTGTIGRFCSIAPGAHAGHVEHPTHYISTHPLFYGAWKKVAKDFHHRNRPMIDKARAQAEPQIGRSGKIEIGNDVWIGAGALLRRGVQIGDGAIIGARSVVTRDVPPYAIVGGIPARVIRYRFEPDVIEELLRLQWWLYGLSALEGADFTDIDLALWRISENISSGRAELYQAPVLNVSPSAVDVLNFGPESGMASPS